ncbi:hypothetical protein ID866_3986 [Astraeus odoratus]|nr:hypothetical protein ID866_3986 [Astraeus odoratus]
MPSLTPAGGKPATSLRRFIRLYAPDWIVTGGFWLLFYIIGHYITGFKRHFSLSDVSLRYPLDISHAVHQRVGSGALHFLSTAVPLIFQTIVNLATLQSWIDFHHSTLGLLLSITMTECITQIVKVTTAKHILEDGWRSFPSGHASMSFSGLGFLTFYLAGKLHLFDTRGHAVSIAVAASVAISRTMDYRHHWQDVVAGSALGLAVSYFCYRQYYPSLGATVAHVPYMTRLEEHIRHTEDDGPIYRDRETDDIGQLEPREEDVGLLSGRQMPSGSR